MSIEFQILGRPGYDNALHVSVNSGHAFYRLQFDCGDKCLTELKFSETLAIDHLFFSHLHMDHVAGFDLFFRRNFKRESKPNVIWGPPDTTTIIHHRFRGYMWNLTADLPGQWLVNDIYPDHIKSRRFLTSEAFEYAHDAGVRPFNGVMLENDDFRIGAFRMKHLTPSMAYIVREKPHLNVNKERLETSGLKPGPWIEKLKSAAGEKGDFIEIENEKYSLKKLRDDLLEETPGDSLAYMTDFLMDEAARARLLPSLQGIKYMICESQYLHDHKDLADKTCHMTCTQVAEIARAANVDNLFLFHVSDRYQPNELKRMLAEARSIFPNARFSEHWKI
ncbi:MAG: ribonuclease Z [Calditrichia bacterium]